LFSNPAEREKKEAGKLGRWEVGKWGRTPVEKSMNMYYN
jgi:hypothetical protein